MGTIESSLGWIFELQIDLRIVLSEVWANNIYQWSWKLCKLWSYFWQALCFVFLIVPHLHFTFFSSTVSLAPPFYPSDHPSLPFSSSFSILTRRCPSSPLMRSCCLHGLKGSSRKDPSARLVFSRGCIQYVALFFSAYYHIYPTTDALYCRSQNLFSNLLQSCMDQ